MLQAGRALKAGPPVAAVCRCVELAVAVMYSPFLRVDYPNRAPYALHGQRPHGPLS